MDNNVDRIINAVFMALLIIVGLIAIAVTAGWIG
jgi:hypothetical protein